MDVARPRAAPSGTAPGMTEPAADRAVTVLYQSHYVALVREATLLVGDFATAEDVVQDSFIARTAPGGGCGTPARRCSTCAVR